MSMYNPCAECLNRYGHDYGPECDDRCLYAVGIKAQRNQTRADAVSREMALQQAKAAYHCAECMEELGNLYEENIKSLPSVTLALPTSADAVSREAVIQAMYDLCDTGETLTENQWRDNPHIDAVIDAINGLPSVQPERPKGEWIESEFDESVYCSECNAEFESKYNFCPHCGAGLRGGGNV